MQVVYFPSSTQTSPLLHDSRESKIEQKIVRQKQWTDLFLDNNIFAIVFMKRILSQLYYVWRVSSPVVVSDPRVSSRGR